MAGSALVSSAFEVLGVWAAWACGWLSCSGPGCGSVVGFGAAGSIGMLPLFFPWSGCTDSWKTLFRAACTAFVGPE